jgi:hypothetical protein
VLPMWRHSKGGNYREIAGLGFKKTPGDPQMWRQSRGGNYREIAGLGFNGVEDRQCAKVEGAPRAAGSTPGGTPEARQNAGWLPGPQDPPGGSPKTARTRSGGFRVLSFL